MSDDDGEALVLSHLYNSSQISQSLNPPKFRYFLRIKQHSTEKRVNSSSARRSNSEAKSREKIRSLPSQSPVAAATATAEFRIHLSPPPPTKCGVQNCQWQPYSNSGDFKANTALVIVFLFCTLICGLAINFAIKHMCKRQRRIQSPETVSADTEKVIQVPSLIYSEGMQLAAAEECAICLSEFAIGERIRILEKCSHGFHVQCIERWLISCSSCPICRAYSR
ncbi:RING-H2 finger protein ATL79-like [Salvia splendens]|uniref:RING-H2 finger protein ATL79-like n=1 Tax=Salvia splendens TaxID=180675 RepID=UPI001C260D7D|nr:RING-H2 finger protein ATL79-like [Salvia splendens]